MDLPSALRAGVERALEGIALSELQQAADRLSERYRAERRDGLHLNDDLAVRAYLATRLPATYAAIRDALGRAVALMPDFAPHTLLDVGAGPGTALWAARDCWPSLAEATLVETSAAARTTGEALLASATGCTVQWQARDVIRDDLALPEVDLVTLAYVLDELPPQALAPLVARLWNATRHLLLIVEPGTPAGWRRILAARDHLIAAGAHLVAPCPHAQACPLTEPGWCHFVRRVARSRLHRLTKRGDVPWEDEKFIYLAAARAPALRVNARVLAPPRVSHGKAMLKLCCNTGALSERLLTRRDGDAYKAARRASWGDALADINV